MRILHVISAIDPQYGGPAVALLGLAKAQAAAGLEVVVAATWQQGTSLAAVDELRAHKIEVYPIGPATDPLSRHPDVQRIVGEQVARADVVHIHALWEEIQHQAARAAQAQRKPYIVRPCGMLDPWSLSQGRLKKLIYMFWRLRRNLNRAAALHFTSELERDLTEPLDLKAPAIIEPNGVDLAEFVELPPAGTFRAKHPTIGERRIVLFLSRVHPKKGLDLLIPAFAKAQPRDPMLVIAGPDADGYVEQVKQIAAQHGIADRILFTGMLRGRERVEALVDARVFVLPSYQENFGIAVVEALACGTPVIISDQVNIHREITAARVGAVVPTQVAPLGEEISRFVGDDSVRSDASDRSRPFVREHYDWQKIAQRWAGHYARLCSPPASVP